MESIVGAADEAAASLVKLLDNLSEATTTPIHITARSLHIQDVAVHEIQVLLIWVLHCNGTMCL